MGRLGRASRRTVVMCWSMWAVAAVGDEPAPLSSGVRKKGRVSQRFGSRQIEVDTAKEFAVRFGVRGFDFLFSIRRSAWRRFRRDARPSDGLAG